MGGELFDHIINTGKVGFRAFEFQLGLVAALIQAGNPRSFLKDTTTVFRLGVDQFGDLSLTDKGGRMCPRGGIGKQHRDIAGTDIFGIHFIGRTRVTGDAANDFDAITFVEPRGREAFGIVDHQCHFGKVACGARRGPRKDHVLHTAAAHRLGTVFAHDPAQRL